CQGLQTRLWHLSALQPSGLSSMGTQVPLYPREAAEHVVGDKERFSITLSPIHIASWICFSAIKRKKNGSHRRFALSQAPAKRPFPAKAVKPPLLNALMVSRATTSCRTCVVPSKIRYSRTSR